MHIQWARKNGKLDFPTVHKQVLYGTWVRGIAFYVPVYFTQKLLILMLQTNTLIFLLLLKCKLLCRKLTE